MFRRTAQLPMPPQPQAVPPPEKSRRWLRWAIPLLAFLIGVGVGGADGGTDPQATPEVQTLQGQLRSSQAEADQLSDEVEDTRAQIREASAEAEARLEEQAAELAQQEADLKERRAEVEARAQEVYAREKAVRASEREVEAPSNPPAPAPAPAVEVPTSVYYDNCDAARADGAAPVRVGDPGYARHLDRDGDGVGCE